jgi:hypothetical protein
MSKAILIFNGLHFPMPVIDRAFAWAQQSHGSLVALFLRSKTEDSEGYLFPSDLDAAENLADDADAERVNVHIIDSNIRMLMHQAATQHIELRTEILVDPKDNAILDEVGGGEYIFVGEKIIEPAIMATKSIDLPKLLKDINARVEFVRE